MADTIRPSRTDSYEHTISGLLTKRADLFHEAERIRYRLAEIKNDILAVDRVLGTLGYAEDPNAAMPRAKSEGVFGQGELTRSIVNHLRTAPLPFKSRQVTEAILSAAGQDIQDRKLVSERTKLVSRALRRLRLVGRVEARRDERGNVVWGMVREVSRFDSPGNTLLTI